MKNLLVIGVKKCKIFFYFVYIWNTRKYFIFFHFPGGERVSPVWEKDDTNVLVTGDNTR
jgi:hypothetical protein